MNSSHSTIERTSGAATSTGGGGGAAAAAWAGGAWSHPDSNAPTARTAIAADVRMPTDQLMSHLQMRQRYNPKHS